MTQPQERIKGGVILPSNEVQEYTFTASTAATFATSGTYTLSFRGVTTGSIAYNTTPANVQAALELLPTVGAGNVFVTGANRGGYVITFQGVLAGQDIGDNDLTWNLGTMPTYGIDTFYRATATQGRFAGLQRDPGLLLQHHSHQRHLYHRLQHLHHPRHLVIAPRPPTCKARWRPWAAWAAET